MPRNPLKSLDSDERIQENPRQSNTRANALRRETATSQEKPTDIDRLQSELERAAIRLNRGGIPESGLI
jgi:hypothetical protein